MVQVISVDELVSLKVLPFDLYNGNGEKILNVGEVLTPGKLLQLRYISTIYREEVEEYLEDIENETTESPEIYLAPPPEKPVGTELEISVSSNVPFEAKPKNDVFPGILSSVNVPELFKDDVKINKLSSIQVNTQISLKTLHTKALNNAFANNHKNNLKNFLGVRDKLVDEVIPLIDKVIHRSELKILGEYYQYHGLNVALLSTVLAKKLGLKDEQINDIALGAVLHDIGKTKIPYDILSKPNPSGLEIKLINLHAQIGYKILSIEMGLPEHICKIALEHHEKCNGTGYPYGISGELISKLSQIVSVCNVYDNLVSKRGHVQVKTPREALRVMTEIGSKWFIPDVLYTFLHMSSYNDLVSVEELVGQ